MIVVVDLFVIGILILWNKIINFFLNKVCEKNISFSWNGVLLYSNVMFFVSVDIDRIWVVYGGDFIMFWYI